MSMSQQLLVNNAAVTLNTRATDGGWFDAGAFSAPWSLTIQGLAAGDVVDIHVSNLPTPASSDLGIKYGADITADGKVEIPACYHWIRVRRTAIAGAGIVNAALCAERLV